MEDLTGTGVFLASQEGATIVTKCGGLHRGEHDRLRRHALGTQEEIMEESFKRILVTTDFSEAGDHAISHAFRMAADHGAEVLLLHVVEIVVAPNPLYAHYYPTDLLTPEIRVRAENDARQAILDRTPKNGPLAAVPHQVVVAHGMPAEEIIRTAREQQADLIVISTHGRTGLRHLILGSTAERVIRHAHCPVLVVR
jgi:nucleotide-binding universal stress UspA family protein